MTVPRAQRLDNARARLTRLGIDALLVGASPDLQYLTGHNPPPLERLTLLVLPATGEASLVVPALEAPMAEAHLDGLGVELKVWQETQDPVALVRQALDVAGASAGTLAVADQLWAAFLLRIQAALPEATFTHGSPVLRALRVVKDAGEVAALAAAGAAIDRVTARLDSWIRPGRSEREIAADLDRAIRDAGHEETSFVIVGSGPNSASPHHHPGDRRLAPGDAVVVDIGGRLDGYCSDTTRTVVVGEPDPEFTRMYEVLLAAQEAGCAAVKPGVTAQAVDAACREVITRAGYGEYFIHRTGHGIGLETHEDPYLVEGNQEVLEPGMAFSVEPGIYIPGRFGARIEDILVCTDDGGRRLNNTPRALRVLA
jgi:Xaa-Pro aminopeptidase